MANEVYTPTSGQSTQCGVWQPIVTISGVDVSDRIVGDIRIDADEGSARIAELTIRPTAGTPFAISQWVGQPVTIDIAPVPMWAPDWRRLFTGVIDTPTLDFDLRVISLRCTDDLQNWIDALDNSTIDVLTSAAYHSTAIFDSAARGWVRLQDRLSTIPAAIDQTPTGSIRLTDWQPKLTPDMSFTDAHIIDGSIDVSLSSRSQLVNQVDVTFAYRFPRVKAECYPLAYQYVDVSTIAQHALNLNWWLQRDAVKQAIQRAGGTIEAITYLPLPTYPIGTWTPNPLVDFTLCMGFSAEVSFDYGQMIEEQHAITVWAYESIQSVGTIRESLQGALEGKYPPMQTAEQSLTLFKNDIMGIPPLDQATPQLGYTVAADVTLTDDTDRYAANRAMEALIAMAKNRIWGSHRANTVRARVPLNPDVDLDKTIDIAVSTVHACGKCVSLSHRLSTETGEAVTEFALAICSVAGTGTQHVDTPTVAPNGSSPGSSSLVLTPSAVFNYLPTQDHVFTVTFPGVEQIERDKATINLATYYDAGFVEDTLEIQL